MARKALLCLQLVVLCAGAAAAADGKPFPEPPNTPAPGASQQEPQLYEDYGLVAAGYKAGLYDKDTGQFKPYGAGYHSVYDDDYFMPDDPREKLLAECTGKENGTPLNSTRACEIRISSGDAQAPGLSGGVDGVYKPVACNDGRPMYLRQGSPLHEDRVLWYSNRFTDWDIANGTKPVRDEDNTDVMVYGGSPYDVRPQHVLDWHVASSFVNSSGNGTKPDYVPITLKVNCANLTGKARVPVVAGKGGKGQGKKRQQPLGAPSPAIAAPDPAGAQPEQQQQQPETPGDAGGQVSGGNGEGSSLDDYNMADSEGMGWREDLTAQQAADVQAQGLKGPVLTHEEMEQQYAAIYKRAQATQDAQRGSNAVLLSLFLVAAVGIAVAGPMIYVRKQRVAARAAAPDGGPVYISLSQAFRGRRAAKREQQE